jgi:nucleoside-diphosphate-sugar epimerase
MNILSSVSSCEKVEWSYAKNKLEAEEVLLEGLKPGRVIICRLGHTFDVLLPVPFGSGDWTFVQWLLDGNPMMLFRGIDSSWSLLHSRDVARRILFLAANVENFTNVLNIANPQSVSWLEIGKAFYSTLRIPEKFRFISLDSLKTLYPYWSESVIFHKQFDEVYVGDEIKMFSQIEDSDWNLATGLSVSLNFYLRNKTIQTVNQFHYEQFSLLAANS